MLSLLYKSIIKYVNSIFVTLSRVVIMQPLVSPVDHESRHNSHHRVEDIQEPRLTEDTPLLHRFPPVQVPNRNPITTIVVTLLLIILLSGIVIGIYLLIIQSRSENVLPPVDRPLQLVSRSQWDPSESDRGFLTMSPQKAKHVVVVQTETRQCYSTKSCIELLHDMKITTAEGNASLPYNFLVSSNGETYEALGWRRQSPLFSQDPSLVLAFIGNFTSEKPPRAQVDEARNLFAESVSHQYLEPSYTVYGGKTDNTPNGLYSTMRRLPQWSSELSNARV